ncbi:unnamed protein product [Vicia faba]|uniref:CCHC-type domain-containing protein n=1 Tax=Vicia faba TaxID=3906 RepID=A0AAV0YJL2_VICFA|nr:unnamed protein product [Vicia faba]
MPHTIIGIIGSGTASIINLKRLAIDFSMLIVAEEEWLHEKKKVCQLQEKGKLLNALIFYFPPLSVYNNQLTREEVGIHTRNRDKLSWCSKKTLTNSHYIQLQSAPSSIQGKKNVVSALDKTTKELAFDLGVEKVDEIFQKKEELFFPYDYKERKEDHIHPQNLENKKKLLMKKFMMVTLMMGKWPLSSKGLQLAKRNKRFFGRSSGFRGSSSRDKGDDQKSCFNCKKSGHFTDDCPGMQKDIRKK